VTDFEPLIKALARRDEVSAAERRLIENLPKRIKSFRKGEELVQEHSRPAESCLVMHGFAAREVYLRDGKRQITAVHIPGDFVDLHAFLLKQMDHSVVALSECQAAFVPHQDLLRVVDEAPHLGRLLWLSTVIDGAIQRAWIACIGRRSSTAHFGHLICELYLRLNAVGLAEKSTFQFPVTQEELADILGLSLVHVNRTLRELRSAGLITWKGSTIEILDFDGLATLSDFDPSYLNLVSEPR
jgi:CRP-like cAMP-binding protein